MIFNVCLICYELFFFVTKVELRSIFNKSEYEFTSKIHNHIQYAELSKGVKQRSQILYCFQICVYHLNWTYHWCIFISIELIFIQMFYIERDIAIFRFVILPLLQYRAFIPNILIMCFLLFCFMNSMQILLVLLKLVYCMRKRTYIANVCFNGNTFIVYLIFVCNCLSENGT